MTNKLCSDCGKPAVSPDAKACTNCGKAYPRTESRRGNARPSEKGVYVKEKSTAIAILSSFIFPGAGQVYNGRLKKGLLMTAGFWIGMVLVIPAFVVWVYSMYDAYNEAKKISKGELPFAESPATDAIIYIITYLVLVIVLFLLVYLVYLLMIP